MVSAARSIVRGVACSQRPHHLSLTAVPIAAAAGLRLRLPPCSSAAAGRRWWSVSSSSGSPPPEPQTPPPERKVTVYTRTGDKGTSSLFNGTRRPKSHLIFHALGASDSLNAQVGVARELLLLAAVPPPPQRQQEQHGEAAAAAEGLAEQLEQVQSLLIDLGAAVATPPDGSSSAEALARVRFDGGAHARTLGACVVHGWWGGAGRAGSYLHTLCPSFQGGGGQAWPPTSDC
jgi:cob(I)alamin adenosyltransferase